jgi:signal peptidase II
MSAASLSRMGPMLAMVTGAVALDQAIKYLVETRLPFHELIPVMPMLGLFRTWNEGIAFSLLKSLPDTGLLILTALVIVFVVFLWRRTPSDRRIAHLGFALIIGGALGNLIDRAVYGHVVDYILFHTESLVVCGIQSRRQLSSPSAPALIVLDEVIATLRERKSKQRIRLKRRRALDLRTVRGPVCRQHQMRSFHEQPFQGHPAHARREQGHVGQCCRSQP